MKAYQIEFCGETRIVVHPLGLPPSWTESNLPPAMQEAAISAAASLPIKREAMHFTPDLRLVESFPIK